MESCIRDKSKMFAIRIVKLYRHLCSEKNERILSNELLHETDYLSDNEFESINQDNIALKRMLSSITLTTSNNLKKDNS